MVALPPFGQPFRVAHPNQRSWLPAELRRPGVPGPVRAWVCRSTGSEVTGVRRLAGASSTAVHGVRLADGRRLVLRRYAWSHFRETEPEAPPREVDALRLATSAGLPAPEVVAADPTGSEVGDGIPALLMTLLPGTALAVPDLQRLAELAARVHAVDASAFPHVYFPWYDSTTTSPPPAAGRPRLWEEGIRVWHECRPDYPPAFVHRDFHPGNVLWLRGRVTGVVDWPNACRGPAGADVAHCRANLLRWAGPAEADAFRAAYESVTGTTYDPYWEVASVMEYDMQGWSAEEVAGPEERLARALEELR